MRLGHWGWNAVIFIRMRNNSALMFAQFARNRTHQPSEVYYFGLYTFPSFMTNSTCSSTLTSCRGSPETAITSAYFPGLIEPNSLECPNRSAAEVVAA